MTAPTTEAMLEPSAGEFADTMAGPPYLFGADPVEARREVADPPPRRPQPHIDTPEVRHLEREGMVVPRRGLFARLADGGRVTLVSAPAGSGKTVLVRSWIRHAGLAGSAAWVSVEPEEHGPQGFWLSVLDAIRDTRPGSAVVRDVTAAPDLDRWRLVECLLEDLASLADPVWLVIDEAQELRSSEGLAQLALFLRRAPQHFRIVLCTRFDLQVGLHRLRVEGAASEIRASDLRFTLDDTRSLFAAAGLELSDPALALLHERTEGWAAGLRLAALSLDDHPDPEQFAAEFSGSERTVAEYLLAEVLERQPQEVRRLLLRTSLLKRVSGSLADALTGGSDGERILLGLEATNAFVVAVDAGRSWFRYHRLFAELLQMELRRIAPEQPRVLHSLAAEWFAEHGHPIEAIRHAQAAEDWSLATRLLVDNCLRLYLGGRMATVHELLTAFPARLAAADPELNAVGAADELNGGSVEAAERHLALATGELASLPPERRGRLEVMLGSLRLAAARQRGDLPAVIEAAQRELAPVAAADVAELGMVEERRVMALISLGTAELWTGRLADAERHLDQAIATSRRIEQPYLEFTGLAHAAAATGLNTSFARAEERSLEAIELAERHGWSEDPIAALAYTVRGGQLVWQGRLREAEPWLERAERALKAELEPAAAVLLHTSRGGLQLARGQHEEALEHFRSAERLAHRLITPHMWTRQLRSSALQTLVVMGRQEEVEQALAEIDECDRDSTEIRTAEAMLRLAQNDPQAAASVLATVIDHADLTDVLPMFAAHLRLLNASAHEALGDDEQAEQSLELALEFAEGDGLLWPFLIYADRELLERHPRHRTAHRALLSDLLNLLNGQQPTAAAGPPEPLREPLSQSETRVLRYLPTNLSQTQIANELYVSVHTIRTHVKHLYAKLDVHERAEAVERARGLGLLAPSLRKG